jgi:hypothetical protein
MRKLAVMALMAIFPLGLFAERVTLRDGTVVYGRFVSGTSNEVTIMDDNGVRRRFNLDQIQTIDFNTLSGPSRSSVSGDQRDRSYGDNRDARNRSDNSSYSNANDYAVLPAGTQLSVRTDQEINVNTATQGRTYPASIAQDVLDSGGNVVVPRGSDAELVVREVNEGGTLSSGNLMLDLQSVRVNGRRMMVSTEDVKQGDDRGIGANRRTAEMVGGGAVLGTLLGAMAGGGKGAAIGAIAGAAAGGGVQVLTRGKEIRVPAETVLNFRLDQPLHLREMR